MELAKVYMSIKFFQISIYIGLFLVPQTLVAQDPFEWWNNKHNWDGITHWTRYMTISPKFMGPNALPVPEMNKGIVSNEFSFEIRGDAHWGIGDKTQNIYSRLYVPLAKDRVGVELFYVPFEWYKLTAATRDLRKARELEAQGFAAGDVYFGTTIQAIREKNKHNLPSLVLGLYGKTASGTDLFNARYTDTPGYYFDGHFGKKYILSEKSNVYLRLYSMFGFYVWQTYSGRFLQNDAFSFGTGTTLGIKNIEITNDFAGYIGYIDNGDKPLVYRFLFAYKFPHLTYQLRYQWGLHDYDYQTVGLSVIFRFRPKFLDAD